MTQTTHSYKFAFNDVVLRPLVLVAPQRRFSIVLSFFLFLMLACLRMPRILWEGRFWAEEGRVYYHNAWQFDFWHAITRPEMGYLSVIPTVATILARYIVSVENGPRFTVGIALLVQTLPLVCLSRARDMWLQTRWVLPAAALILATPPIGDEVWINTPNSQFQITLLLIFVLALRVDEARSIPSKVFRGLLVLAPLCSPSAVVLVPLFTLRALINKSKYRAMQAFLLAIGCLLQFGLFYSAMPGRGHFLGPATVVSIITTRHIVYPLFGFTAAQRVAVLLQSHLSAGHFPVAASIVVCAAISGLIYSLRQSHSSSALWLCLGGFAIGGLSYFGALETGFELIAANTGQRYAFAPSMAIEIAVLCFASSDTGVARILSRCFVLWFIVVGLVQSLLPHPSFIANGPAWRLEVSRWSANPTRTLAIWPTGWTMTLPAEAANASRVRASP